SMGGFSASISLWLLLTCSFFREVRGDSPGAVAWIFGLIIVSAAMFFIFTCWFCYKHPDLATGCFSTYFRGASIPILSSRGASTKKKVLPQHRKSAYAEEDLQEIHRVREENSRNEIIEIAQQSKLRSIAGGDQESGFGKNLCDDFQGMDFRPPNGIQSHSEQFWRKSSPDINTDIEGGTRSAGMHSRQISAGSGRPRVDSHTNTTTKTTTTTTKAITKTNKKQGGLTIEVKEGHGLGLTMDVKQEGFKGFAQTTTPQEDVQAALAFFADHEEPADTSPAERHRKASVSPQRGGRSLSPNAGHNHLRVPGRPLAHLLNKTFDHSPRENKETHHSPASPARRVSLSVYEPRRPSVSPSPDGWREAAAHDKDDLSPEGRGRHSGARRNSASGTSSISMSPEPEAPMPSERPRRKSIGGAPEDLERSPRSRNHKDSANTGRRPSLTNANCTLGADREKIPPTGAWSGTLTDKSGRNDAKYNLAFTEGGKITGSRDGAYIEGTFYLADHGATASWVEAHASGLLKVSMRLDNLMSTGQHQWTLAGQYSGSQHGIGKMILTSAKK
ncbi:unnamed protein product, partial [Polarella glacialis]